MSSKLLSGDSARLAEQVTWKKLSPGGRQEGSCEPASQAQLESLLARIAQLEREILRREQEAFAAGNRKGEAAGQEQAAARLEPVAEQLARTIADLSATRRQLRRDAEQDVVRLALAIGKRIVHRELSIDPEVILGVVKAALEKLEGREVDRVRVNREDAEMVRKQFERLGERARVEVVADPRLGRGAVVFETARGSFDASVDTQLEEIQRGLVDRIRLRS